MDILKEQGFELDPVKIELQEDKILDNEELIKEASELWVSKENLIRMILQARINAMAYEALKGSPELLPSFKKAMAEVGAIAGDFQAYKGIADRSKEEKNKDNSAKTETQTPPSPKEGEEAKVKETKPKDINVENEMVYIDPTKQNTETPEANFSYFNLVRQLAGFIVQ